MFHDDSDSCARVAGYHVVREIGRGSQATVYEAWHPMLRQACALKLFSDADPETVALFWKEHRAAMTVGAHPNIVGFLEAGPVDRRWYIAMELLEGETLDTILDERGPMDAHATSALLRQLASALDHAHKAGVVHRDVKPANLLIVREPGQDSLLKVLDFGVAKVLDPTNEATATLAGTPFYMAPEQLGEGLRGLAAKSGFTVERAVSAKTDTWPFALVAYEMLTGLPPGQYWGKDNAFDVWFKVAIDPLEKATARAGDRAGALPHGFDAWFAQCLHKTAKLRPSAVEAASLLAAIIKASASISQGMDAEEAATDVYPGARVSNSAAASPAKPVDDEESTVVRDSSDLDAPTLLKPPHHPGSLRDPSRPLRELPIIPTMAVPSLPQLLERAAPRPRRPPDVADRLRRVDPRIVGPVVGALLAVVLALVLFKKHDVARPGVAAAAEHAARQIRK